MADYNSSYTGPQIDSAVGQVIGDAVIKNTAQSLTDAQKAQARSNIGVTDNVFMAIYGTTTEEELTAAFNAGKQIFARGPNFPASIYTLYGYVMDYDPVSGMGYEFYFSRLENTTLQRIQCSRGQWSTLANIEMVDTSDLSQYRTSAEQDQIDAESVRVVSQTFTDAQKQQARSNIGAADAASILPIADNAGYHNSVYRGKNLGTSVTAEQWAAISAGTFDDLYIGDYWVINGITWRIAAVDYWYGTGDTRCYTHHLAIMPDELLKKPIEGSTHYLNASNTSTGAYVGTDYYSGANSVKADCTSMAQAAFGASHILTHREYFANAVSNNIQSGGGWYDSTVELPTEQMAFGCRNYSNVRNGTNNPNLFTVGATQLPLFLLDRTKIICNEEAGNWWLRDVNSGNAFCNVGDDGLSNCAPANAWWCGIRPIFAICA